MPLVSFFFSHRQLREFLDDEKNVENLYFVVIFLLFQLLQPHFYISAKRPTIVVTNYLGGNERKGYL